MENLKAKILLVGNPNCGKTTIFNSLSGLRGKVGNYSGVTVDRKTGSFSEGGVTIDVEDLPGIYTLSVSSLEEQIARDTISEGNFDLILNVVDSSNFERNLFLTLQLAEMGLPMAVALNMSDELEAHGKYIDAEALSEKLGVPVVKTVGYDTKSVKALKEFLAEAVLNPKSALFPWECGSCNFLCKKFDAIRAALESELPEDFRQWAPWLALRALENDKLVLDTIAQKAPKLSAYIGDEIKSIEDDTGEYPEIFVAAARYKIVGGICERCLKTRRKPRSNATRMLDSVFLNKFIGIPLFFALMYGVFQFVFTLGDPLMGFMESLFGALAAAIEGLWPQGSESLAKSLILDGIIGGVGGVFVFLPNIILLFVALSLLEDSGYMARAAFLCDRLLKRFGISGSSIIPMLVGFGCTVPAIIGTRTLKSKTERLVTIIVLPLFSCGARFPVYVLLIPAFFAPAYGGTVMFGIYLFGIAVALILAKLLRLTVFKGAESTFIIELPPYRLPRLKNMIPQIWARAFGFIKKAGTIILGMSVILWAGATFPQKKEFSKDYEAMAAAVETSALAQAQKREKLDAITYEQNAESFEYTISGRIGTCLAPVFKPLGFDAKITSALIGALAAKEVFISQLGIIYGMGDSQDEESESLRVRISRDYTPLQGVSILLFVLLSLPCIATLATTYAETRSLKITLGQVAGLTLIAYFVCLIFYQTALLF